MIHPCRSILLRTFILGLGCLILLGIVHISLILRLQKIRHVIVRVDSDQATWTSYTHDKEFYPRQDKTCVSYPGLGLNSIYPIGKSGMKIFENYFVNPFISGYLSCLDQIHDPSAIKTKYTFLLTDGFNLKVQEYKGFDFRSFMSLFKTMNEKYLGTKNIQVLILNTEQQQKYIQTSIDWYLSEIYHDKTFNLSRVLNKFQVIDHELDLKISNPFQSPILGSRYLRYFFRYTMTFVKNLFSSAEKVKDLKTPIKIDLRTGFLDLSSSLVLTERSSSSCYNKDLISNYIMQVLTEQTLKNDPEQTSIQNPCMFKNEEYMYYALYNTRSCFGIHGKDRVILKNDITLHGTGNEQECKILITKAFNDIDSEKRIFENNSHDPKHLRILSGRSIFLKNLNLTYYDYIHKKSFFTNLTYEYVQERYPNSKGLFLEYLIFEKILERFPRIQPWDLDFKEDQGHHSIDLTYGYFIWSQTIIIKERVYFIPGLVQMFLLGLDILALLVFNIVLGILLGLRLIKYFRTRRSGYQILVDQEEIHIA